MPQSSLRVFVKKTFLGSLNGWWLFRPFGEQYYQWTENLEKFPFLAYVLCRSEIAVMRTRCVIDCCGVYLLVSKRSFLFLGVSLCLNPCLRVIHVCGVWIAWLANKSMIWSSSMIFAWPVVWELSIQKRFCFFRNGGWHLYSVAGHAHLCKRAFYRIAREGIEDV
jgi:hypothetical protein